MTRYVFDLETNGLLDELDTIHCLALLNLDTDEILSFADQPGYAPIREGLALLSSATFLVAHNGIRFDVPALKKLHPTWRTEATLRDTLLCARVIWPEIGERDAAIRKKRPSFMPGHLVSRHSLEAWGYRLGEHKGEYKGGWEKWSPEMHSYMEQDVRVTAKLWRLIESKNWSERCLDMEHRFAEIIFLQERHGFGFDLPKAHALHAALVKRRLELETELQEAFPPWWIGETTTPPRTVNYKRPEWGEVERVGKNGRALKSVPVAETYIEGVPYSKLERVTFNPASRQHIADRLKKLRGWKPAKFTNDGHATVDEDVLGALPYPEAKLLTEYLMLEKRVGQLADGKNAWLRLERNGRIHGEVNTNGAVTGRCTHSKPNVAQVPSLVNANGPVPFGRECRELFIPRAGYVQVGADASGLELRTLAHYMAKWDGGAYSALLLTDDIHTVNQKAAGLPTRQNAKTFIYAFLYGAGDQKLGSIVAPEAGPQKQKKIGAELRKLFLTNLPALAALVAAVKKAATERGHLVGIDGRILTVRSPHSALNTLLQNAGAVAVKFGTVELWKDLEGRGWRHGIEWAQMAHVHDEIQAEVQKALAEDYGMSAVAAFARAGEILGFRCPLTGEYKIGSNWADCH